MRRAPAQTHSPTNPPPRPPRPQARPPSPSPQAPPPPVASMILSSWFMVEDPGNTGRPLSISPRMQPAPPGGEGEERAFQACPRHAPTRSLAPAPPRRPPPRQWPQPPSAASPAAPLAPCGAPSPKGRAPPQRAPHPPAPPAHPPPRTAGPHVHARGVPRGPQKYLGRAVPHRGDVIGEHGPPPRAGGCAPGRVAGSEEPSGRGRRSSSQWAKKQMGRLQFGPCSQMQVRNRSGCSLRRGRGGGGCVGAARRTGHAHSLRRAVACR